MGKVVFNAGIYDLTHQGHINLFKKMREAGGRTIAVIHDDKSCYEIKGKIPVQRLEHRIQNIGIIGLIDEVVITRTPDPAPEFEQIIMKHPEDEIVYMRGNDLTDDFPGKWMLDKHKVEIQFVPYTIGVSSTQLREAL